MSSYRAGDRVRATRWIDEYAPVGQMGTVMRDKMSYGEVCVAFDRITYPNGTQSSSMRPVPPQSIEPTGECDLGFRASMLAALAEVDYTAVRSR